MSANVGSLLDFSFSEGCFKRGSRAAHTTASGCGSADLLPPKSIVAVRGALACWGGGGGGGGRWYWFTRGT